jgi:tetratricopeptide (TPR) repeat protein
VGQTLREQALALAVLIPVSAVPMLWAPNCAYGTGLLFFALFPGVTLVFAVAVATFLTRLSDRRRIRLAGLVGTGLIVSLVGPLYDLGFHPQFYTYNHVFGGVLGPIYDEQLAVRPGLFVFRGLTLLWAGALFGSAHWIGGGRPSRWVRAATLACLAAIIGIYVFPARAGINTTHAHLQQHLGGHHRTAHVDLYYDPEAMGEKEAQTLAADLESDYRRMAGLLNVEASEVGRVAAYIYPSPHVKGRLTGARRTSVSPVWLARSQLHLLRDRFEASASHELAHVFSRPFGLPVLNASWAVGLVEGWAVALEEPAGQLAPDDLVAVSAETGTKTSLEARADGIARMLSPWGFWTGRGAVSYATMGSFVSHLLDTYGAEPLKRVYARADFKAAYGKSVTVLAREWAGSLRQQSAVSVAARDLVQRQFTRPSLFETTCPHYVPAYRRKAQEARRVLAEGDTSRAVRLWKESVAQEPRFVASHTELARVYLATGRLAEAADVLGALLDRIDPPHPPAALIRLADVRGRQGRARTADSLYRAALRDLPRHWHDARSRIRLRALVADRPDVLGILTSGDSSAVQARRLDAVDSASTAVRIWAALRWQEAYAYDRAADRWMHGVAPMPDGWPAGRPTAWGRSLRLRVDAWHARAALHAGAPERARRLAEQAADGYRRYGARSAAAALDRLADRAAERSAPRAPDGEAP